MSVKYQTYTAKEIREWVESGRRDDILNHAISPARAYALINCPCAHEDDILVIAAKDSDRVVGYAAVIPEHLERPNIMIGFGTTLWAHPDYADEFIGYNLIQRFWQAYPNYYMMSMDAMPAAVIIDKLLGARVISYERKAYVLRRNIHVHSMRHIGSWLLEPYRKYRQNKVIKHVLSTISQDVRVVSCAIIDTKTYAFIQAHSINDTFLRSREMLNWILRYPFMVENPLMEYAKSTMEFSDQTLCYRTYCLQVYKAEELIGVVILLERKGTMHVKMLYTEDRYDEIVYAVIINAMMYGSAKQIYSLYPKLNAYIEERKIALWQRNSNIAITYPKQMNISHPLILQAIDGDMFVC